MKVAAIQMVSGPGSEENLATARGLLEQAAQAGAELACCPVFCRHGPARYRQARLPGDSGVRGPIQSFLAAPRANWGCGLWAAPFPAHHRPQRVRNTTLVFAPDGRRVARYDKIHLFWFDNGREQFRRRPRDRSWRQRPVQFDPPARDGHRWRVGLSMCYDLRFPELVPRPCARAGPLLVPSAFTHTGQAHWGCCAPAPSRNLCLRGGGAQGGGTNGRHTWGHSMVVDPGARSWRSRPRAPAWWPADLDAERLRRAPAVAALTTAFYEHPPRKPSWLHALAQRWRRWSHVHRPGRSGGVHAGHHGGLGRAVRSQPGANAVERDTADAVSDIRVALNCNLQSLYAPHAFEPGLLAWEVEAAELLRLQRAN